MAIKRYKLEYSSAFKVVVDIDDEKCNEAFLHQINGFWGGDDDRLFDADDDVLTAVLRMLVVMAAQESIEYWLSVETQLRTKPLEGWPPLDGSYGITLISASRFEFDDSEISISCMKGEPA